MDDIVKIKSQLSRRGKLNEVRGDTFNILESGGGYVVRIGEIGGYTAVRLYYHGGQLAMYQGQFADGTVQTLWYRDDASVVQRIGGSPGQPQFWGIYDRLGPGNPIFSDDTVSGFGMATPWLALPAFVRQDDITGAGWPQTFATTWTTVARSYARMSHPKIMWDGTLFAAASTTVQAQMLINGTAVGAPATATNGAFAGFSNAGVAIPVGTVRDAMVYVDVQLRVTAGTGDGRVSVNGAFMRQS